MENHAYVTNEVLHYFDHEIPIGSSIELTFLGAPVGVPHPWKLKEAESDMLPCLKAGASSFKTL